MKVLVVSEGKHELGPDSDSSPLVELTRRMLNRGVDFERMDVRDLVIRTHPLRGKFTDYEKKALRWISYATKEGFDALVLVIDLDKSKKRISGIENAQNDQRFTLRRAMAVAIQKFDAWMLADEVALSNVLGNNVQRQPDPETINNPKLVCKKIRDASQCDFGLTEVYFQLAKVIDLDRLSKRCPDGFGPFRIRVEELFTD